MQQQNLKLKEIIWEICGQCKNGCKTCGSKDVWNVPIDEDKIKKIADNIALYPPESIDISGGDPTLVSYKTHKYITDLLKKKKVICKLIVNPKSFQTDTAEKNKIVGLYDHIGLSVNSLEEIELAKSSIPLMSTTVITNFSLVNIFNFNDIKNFVKEYNLGWQIQYTVFKEEDNNLAIYTNKSAAETLKDFIKKAFDEGINIITADNMNCGPCWAGRYTLGITYDGDVVPCLSMRSWVEDINSVSQGNLLTCLTEDRDEIEKLMYEASPLQFIWENELKSYRFHEFKCCKDVTKELIVEYKPQSNIDHTTLPKFTPVYPQPNPGPITVYYGVNINPIVTAYAVTPVYGAWISPFTTSSTKATTGDYTTIKYPEDEKK